MLGGQAMPRFLKPYNLAIGFMFVIAQIGLANAIDIGGGTQYLFLVCLDDDRMYAVPPLRVYVGCDLIDCCPGCPTGVNAIDLKVHFHGVPNQFSSLQFDNLELPAKKILNVDGQSKWTNDSTLLLSPGETTIKGLQHSSKNSLPVAHFAPLIDLNYLTRMREKAIGQVAGPDFQEVEIVVEQFVGMVLVNRVVGKYRFRWCNWPLAPDEKPDSIALKNNTSNDSAIIRFVARKLSGCKDTNVSRTATTGPVGNVLSNESCASETFVFSDDNRMAWISPSTSWTDSQGDVQNVPLNPLLELPVTVWVLKEPVNPRSIDGDVDRARVLFNSMNCGLGLSFVTKDVTAGPDTPSLLLADCAAKARLRANIGFNPGTNVYYVEDIGGFGHAGESCGDNMILVSAIKSDNETLAHELGHALSHIIHTDPSNGFPTNNLMYSGSTGRDWITMGQCFRFNTGPNSVLNTTAIRPSPPLSRFCPDLLGQAPPLPFCPELSWDEIPK
jgi:hypothetical protein